MVGEEIAGCTPVGFEAVNALVVNGLCELQGKWL